MDRIIIAFSLLLFSAFFVGVKILLFPDILQKSTETSESISLRANDTKTAETPLSPEDFFDVSSLESVGITIKKGRGTTTLFHHARILPERDSASLAAFPFVLNGERIGTVFFVRSTESMSTVRLFALLRTILAKAVGTKNLSEPLHTVGEANFYMNDKKSFPKTTFLVVRQGKKVLAFQYDFSYHSLVQEQIPLFFQ